ncbi:MAG: hypothetical protein E5V89_04500 [Mesorhizobium sp.]|nr:MAG: hypothetical protein E5V89_04500 [Mesorhizobium sp.]
MTAAQHVTQVAKLSSLMTISRFADSKRARRLPADEGFLTFLDPISVSIAAIWRASGPRGTIASSLKIDSAKFNPNAS